MFNNIGGIQMKTIKKIVITGGPCSGKSTMLNLIENTLIQFLNIKIEY